MAGNLASIQEAIYDLDERLATAGQDLEIAIRKHLALADSKARYIIPDFQGDLEWFNTSEALSFGTNLKGKLVVLDFFTYCCVNCLHVLPDLEALEEKYTVEDGVAIIGVHSAKFENEKVSANILSAILRYGIHHPVVNDHEAKLWTDLQVACWPTFVIVGPSGQYLHHYVGEGHRKKLFDFVRIAKEYYTEKGEITSHGLPVKFESLPSTPLLFPGKVCTDSDQVVISDTGHHRVLVADTRGLVKHVIGCSERGYQDGSFSEARFSSPQGVVLDGSNLYIADTDNHVIRKADLVRQTVETIAGNGSQGDDKEGGQVGTMQPLSTPWDLCITDGIVEGQPEKSLLFVAMAGTHQVWVYFLKDSAWYKSRQYSAGTCLRFAGSGLEENKNNSYPEKASFAQPSGITSSRALNSLYIADSESSSVRSINLKDGAVKNVVGGDIDPKNLFAYGDVDDKGNRAKLQHPLGVTMVTDEGPLLVADSYNHKIKSVDVKTRSCQTIIGTGKPGSEKGTDLLTTQLNEPGGLWTDQRTGHVYISDTNNHEIKVYESQSGNLYSLPLIFPAVSNEAAAGDVVNTVTTGQVVVKLDLEETEGIHLNEEAPNSWTLYSPDEDYQDQLQTCGVTLKGELTTAVSQILTRLPVSGQEVGVSLKLNLYVCEDSGVCRMAKTELTQTLGGGDTADVVFRGKLV